MQSGPIGVPFLSDRHEWMRMLSFFDTRSGYWKVPDYIRRYVPSIPHTRYNKIYGPFLHIVIGYYEGWLHPGDGLTIHHLLGNHYNRVDGLEVLTIEDSRRLYHPHLPVDFPMSIGPEYKCEFARHMWRRS